MKEKIVFRLCKRVIYKVRLILIYFPFGDTFDKKEIGGSVVSLFGQSVKVL